MDVIEVPLFYGDDPEEWVSWIDLFCSAQGFSDLEKLQFAYGFVEDDALTWFNGETSQSPFTSWVEFKLRLFQRFSKDKESIEALLKQKRELDFERRMSFLDRLEKLFPATEERLEKHNLGGEEKENPSLGCEEELFGFVNTARKETHQQEKRKESEAEMDKDACQVFDKMTPRGKIVTKKRKKKRWKKIAKKNYNAYGRSERYGRFERVMLRNMARWLNCLVLEYTVEKVNKKTGVKMKMHIRQVVDRRLLLSFTKKEKRSKLEHERKIIKRRDQNVSARRQSWTKFWIKWKKQKAKHKYQNNNKTKIKRKFSDNQVVFPLTFSLELKCSRNLHTEWSKKVQRSCRMFHKKFLRGKHLQKERKGARTNSSSSKHKNTKLDQEKLLRSLKMHTFRGHKTWTVREPQRLKCLCHLWNWRNNHMADKIWSLRLSMEKIKPNMEEKRSDGLYLEELNNHHEVITVMLIPGVETAKKKIFWTRGKRHGFRHKLKKMSKEGINNNCAWLYRMWLLQVTQKKKMRKKHVVSKIHVWKNLFAVEVELSSHEKLVKPRKITQKVKKIGCKCFPKYLEEAGIVKEFIQMAYFKRACTFSLGKEAVIAVATVHTTHNEGNTLLRVRVAGVCRRSEVWQNWISLARHDDSIERQPCVSLLGKGNKHDQTVESLDFETGERVVRERLPKVRGSTKKKRKEHHVTLSLPKPPRPDGLLVKWK